MDFGDILAQYDDLKRKERTQEPQRKNKKKANAPERKGDSAERLMQEQSGRRINPTELWLMRYGTVDKDKEIEEYHAKQKLRSHEYIKKMRPDAKLDLHGLNSEQAWSQIQAFVDNCVQRGLRKILFVHGKGIHSHGSDPVLGKIVRMFIEQDKRLGSSGHPDRSMGGTGATWCMIK